MQLLLNDTELYERSLRAADGLDKLILIRPEIEGLEFDEGCTGFTYVDSERNSSSGVRNTGGDDSDYSYTFMYIPESEPRIYRADLKRAGFLIYLTYQSDPLEEIPSLTLTAELAARIP